MTSKRKLRKERRYWKNQIRRARLWNYYRMKRIGLAAFCLKVAFWIEPDLKKAIEDQMGGMKIGV